MKEIAKLIKLVPCATLGTNFVDISDGGKTIAVQVGRESAEKWLADFRDGVEAAQDAYIVMSNIIHWPAFAAGSVVRSYVPKT
jgi:hypothetical protein